MGILTSLLDKFFYKIGSDGKYACKNCEARILPATAKENKGHCLPCAQVLGIKSFDPIKHKPNMNKSSKQESTPKSDNASSTEQDEKYEMLTVEAVNEVLVAIIGLPENDSDINWLNEKAGGEIFTNANPELAKEVFTSKRIMFQTAVALSDPAENPPKEVLDMVLEKLDSRGDSIIVQTGGVSITMPSNQQLPLYVIIGTAFQSNARTTILMKLATCDPLAPGKIIRVS